MGLSNAERQRRWHDRRWGKRPPDPRDIEIASHRARVAALEAENANLATRMRRELWGPMEPRPAAARRDDVRYIDP